MRRALWVAAVLVVLGSGFCAYLRMRTSRAQGAAPPPGRGATASPR